jgi:DNA-binding response OmpR family regulator
VVDQLPDVIVLDSQIGNMGGVAVCMELRLDESVERLPAIPVLILLDRHADVFLARRSMADGWLVKPLDSFRLRRAINAVLAGQRYEEGVPDDDTDVIGTDTVGV